MPDWSDLPSAPVWGTALGALNEVSDAGAKEYIFGPRAADVSAWSS